MTLLYSITFFIVLILYLILLPTATAVSSRFVSCTTTEDCSHLINATCNHTAGSYCDCGEDANFFCAEDSSEIVVNKIGENCESSKNCAIENSTCDKNKKCSCTEGFKESENLRQCLKTVSKLGNSCSEDIQCFASISNSICSDNKCICQNKAVENNGTCIISVSLGECCSDNVECVTNFSSCNDFTCTCYPQYVESRGRCLPLAEKIKDECLDDAQCQNIFGEGSKCLDELCQCKRFFHFNESIEQCVEDILLDGVCQSHDECHQPDQDPNRLICIDGQCKCKVGFQEEGEYCRDPSSSASFLIYSHLLTGLLAVLIHKF